MCGVECRERMAEEGEGRRDGIYRRAGQRGGVANFVAGEFSNTRQDMVGVTSVDMDSARPERAARLFRRLRLATLGIETRLCTDSHSRHLNAGVEIVEIISRWH